MTTKRKAQAVESPAIQALSVVWRNCCKATNHSWERINGGMRSTLELCIGAGLEFGEDDFQYIGEYFRPGYWMNIEDVYCRAIREDNGSAIKAIEKYLKREPFIVDCADPPFYGQTLAHKSTGRKRGRVGVGFKFPWNKEEVTVTSFAGDQGSITACSYKERGKIKRRYTITRQDIFDARAERKAKAKELVAV